MSQARLSLLAFMVTEQQLISTVNLLIATVGEANQVFNVRQLDLCGHIDFPWSAHNSTLENMFVFGCHCALERDNRHVLSSMGFFL